MVLEEIVAKAVAEEMLKMQTEEPEAFKGFQKVFGGVTQTMTDLNPAVQAGTMTTDAMTKAITDMIDMLQVFGLDAAFHWF